MPKKPKNIPLTPEELADKAFVAATKKRSAQMAAIAVIIMVICKYKNVDLRLALGFVVIAFVLVNGLYFYSRKKRQAAAKAAGGVKS